MYSEDESAILPRGSVYLFILLNVSVIKFSSTYITVIVTPYPCFYQWT